jgi:predicted metal-binding membrane protein
MSRLGGRYVSTIFNIRSALWIAFFVAIVVAWSVMFMMANMAGVDLTGRPVGMNMMPMVTFGALFPMWAIMMAAMMLPTLVPTLRSYEDLMVSANGSRAGWSGVLLGYFIVWVGFAALIATAQVTLIAVGAVDALGIASSVWIAAALLIVVGLFQFSRAKEICHGVCHAPMMYFVGHWKTGFRGGLRMGLGLGAFCVGCCWGFMALGFVGGVMSLLWMGLATLFMILEKLPAVGHVVTKPMGVVLILAGIALPVWANL